MRRINPANIPAKISSLDTSIWEEESGQLINIWYVEKGGNPEPAKLENNTTLLILDYSPGTDKIKPEVPKGYRETSTAEESILLRLQSAHPKLWIDACSDLVSEQTGGGINQQRWSFLTQSCSKGCLGSKLEECKLFLGFRIIVIIMK